jgi:putative restriction endonuclease
MNLFLAVTDNDWFRFLRSQGPLDEVNFWRPGGEAGFRALHPGEPLLFKLHSPQDYVVGGGFFTHFSRSMPVSRVWEAFGERNGAATFDEMRRRVSRRLKDEYDNGEPYFPFDGQELWLPPEPRERPGREFLEWHGDVVFRG